MKPMKHSFDRELTKAMLARRKGQCAVASKVLERAEKIGERLCAASGSTRSDLCAAITRRHRAAELKVTRAYERGTCGRKRAR